MATEGRLRVVHLITQLELGGAQRNTLYTLTHLNSDRFEPGLVSGRGGLLDDEARQSGVPVKFFRSLLRPIRPWYDVIALIALYRYLRRTMPQIVHTHSSKAGILGRVAAYAAGTPVIIHTFHGFGFTPDQPAWFRKVLIQVEKLCAHLSTQLIYVSEENQRQAESLRIGPGKPSTLIRSGIAFGPQTVSTLRRELQIPEDAWVVVSVGNFKPQKNPQDLVKVAIAALEQDPRMHFVLSGDGPLRAQVERWVRAQPHWENIHFLGWRRDIPNLLAGSNAFLLTSRWEGLPRAVVEAYSAKRPVVAYAVDGVQEVVQNEVSGFLVPPGDIAGAAQKVIWLKQHPQEASAMGDKGNQRVAKEFDIDLMVRQQEDLYENLFQQVPLKEYYQRGWALGPL